MQRFKDTNVKTKEDKKSCSKLKQLSIINRKKKIKIYTKLQIEAGRKYFQIS